MKLPERLSAEAIWNKVEAKEMKDRTIEILGVSVEVPEHPRFELIGKSWYFYERKCAPTPIVHLNEHDFESACCIAIVAWELEAVRIATERNDLHSSVMDVYSAIGNDEMVPNEACRAVVNAGGWRALLAKSAGKTKGD